MRDYYRVLYPDAKRAKEEGRETYEGFPDIVGVPDHVQVKGRAKIAVAGLWRDAERIRKTKGTGLHTHLVIQERGGEPLLVMRLADYITDMTVAAIVANVSNEAEAA